MLASQHEEVTDEKYVDTKIVHGVTPCQSDDNCGETGFYLCDLDQKVCVHKDLFPMLPLEIGGTFVLMILQTLAVMSGLGGGGIVVPLLMAFFDFDARRTVAISGFTILIGGISRFFLTYKNKHPLKDATTIEYSLVNIMLPTVLLGSVTGVFINIILPTIVQQILMFILFTLLSI